MQSHWIQLECDTYIIETPSPWKDNVLVDSESWLFLYLSTVLCFIIICFNTVSSYFNTVIISDPR